MRSFWGAVVLALFVVSGCSSGNKGDDRSQEKSASTKKKSKDDADDDGGDRSEDEGMPSECKRAAAPSKSDLGLTPADFVACLEKMLAPMKVPEEAKRPFEKKGEGHYEAKDFMAIKMKVEKDRIASMDVFFFNKIREKHGMAAELGGQYATLAIVFPGAEVDPFRGEAIFKKIDAIGRKTNKPVIDYSQDDIALNASFLPVSVRYRFAPKE